MADGRLTPHFARALQVLADGSWHDEEDVLREMMKTIPPGRAVRYAEKRRVAQNKATNQPPAARAVPRSADYLRQLGGRALALSALKNSVRLERKTDVNGRWVRIKPGSRHHPLAQQQIDRAWPAFPAE